LQAAPVRSEVLLTLTGVNRREIVSLSPVYVMRARRLLVLSLALALALPGCARTPRKLAAAPPAPAMTEPVHSAPMAEPQVITAPAAVAVPVAVPVATVIPEPTAAYTLDAGDRLRVVVFGQEGLTNSYAVDASGHITMPLIGTVQARARTTEGLSRAIADKLKNGYIREPHVAVEIDTYRPFFILGEVTAPGQYPYVANMTAETAVAIAGGFAPRADKRKVTLTRTVDGLPHRGPAPLTFPIRPGDTIVVAERWF
jgi:polysaccharide biosynthesis/export protein